jgi:hypothetical protein
MRAYTLKKKKDTDELHLFEGDMTDKSCTSGQKSICRKMDKSESVVNTFTCFTEENARAACAKAGRLVCGTCVSHLYTTY